MKKLIASAAMLTLLFTSCTKDSFTNQQDRSTNTVSKNASAVTRYKGNYDIDLSDPKWSEFNSCTGELISIISGIWHIEYTDIYNGSKENFQYHTNTSKYKLLNKTTGVEYTGSYVSNDSYSFNYINSFPFTYTSTLSVLLTTPGGGNNSILKADFHLTIDANGNETAYVDNFRAGCK
jgi:hypothetical protein